MPNSKTILGGPLTLRGFLRWWGGELRGLIPFSLRRLLGLTRERWIVRLVGDEVDLYRQPDSGMPEIGIRRFALMTPDAVGRRLIERMRRLPQQQLVLRLPSDRVLRKTLSLPVAALENLREVLGFEMDRHTPFRAADVYFDGRVLDVDNASRQARVELTAVPRSVGDAALQRLRAAGIIPRSMDIDSEGGVVGEFNLLAGQYTANDSFRGPRIFESLLAVLSVALAATIIAVPMYRKHTQNVALNEEVDKARREAELMNARSREVELLAEQSRFLEDRRRSSPLALEVLEELSRITPDDAWLQRFSLNSTQLTLQGESATATTLIGIYENSSLLKNVHFNAQLTKNALTSRERFNIGAEIEGASQFRP